MVPAVIARRVLAVLATTGLVALAVTSAHATFHFAHISRVMTGLDGTTDVQYVEITMDDTGQNAVSGSKLSAFKADGTFDHVVLVVPASPPIASGADRPWIMASNAFAAAAGISPDYTFDSTGGKGLFPTDGMLCWGKPSTQTNPNAYVDCVSYGNYTGPANVFTDAPSIVTPFGHGIVRVSSTGSSADDFTCEDPALPHNNDNEEGQIEASSSCIAGECGDGEVQDPEQCDDGDTSFSFGQFCSAECTAVPCGSPTNPEATKPSTTDALFVLKVSVSAATCDPRVCDVNANGSVSTTDALTVLKKAVGQNVALTCPA